MSQSDRAPLFAGLVPFRFLVRGLSPAERAQCLAQPETRHAIQFRFFYALAFQTSVLMPMLEAFAAHSPADVEGNWVERVLASKQSAALVSLALARAFGALIEVPAGVYADVCGARASVRLGLVLQIAAMIGFVALGVVSARAIGDGAPPSWTGIAGVMLLQVGFGAALAFINGADTVLFLSVVRRNATLSDDVKRALEGLGSEIRFTGSVAGVLVGSSFYQCLSFVLPGNDPTHSALRLALESSLFLGTAIALWGAHSAVTRVREDAGGSARFVQRFRQRLRELGLACRSLLSSRRAIMSAAIVGIALAAGHVTAYELQAPLAELGKHSWAHALSFVAISVAATACSAYAGRWVFKRLQLGRADDTSWTFGLLVALLLALPVLPWFAVPGAWWGDVREPESLRIFVFMALAGIALAACNTARGTSEPLLRSVLEEHARRDSLGVPTSLISIGNMLTMLPFVAFSLIIPLRRALAAEPELTRVERTLASIRELSNIGFAASVGLAVWVLLLLFAWRFAFSRRSGRSAA